MAKEQEKNLPTSTAFSFEDKDFILLKLAKTIYRQTSTKNTITHLLRRELPTIKKFVTEQTKTAEPYRIVDPHLLERYNKIWGKVKL